MVFNKKQFIRKELKRLKEAGIVDTEFLMFKRRFVYIFLTILEKFLDNNFKTFLYIENIVKKAWTDNSAKFPLGKDLVEQFLKYNIIGIEFIRDMLYVVRDTNLDFYFYLNYEIDSYLKKDFKMSFKRKGYKIGDLYLDDFVSYNEFSKAVKERFEKKKKYMWLSEEWLDYIFVREQRHKWHIVSPSPWPFVLSFTIYCLILSAYSLLYRVDSHLIWLSIFLVLAALSFWFRDIIREAVFMGYHTIQVQDGLRLAFTLFLVSEVMFFFSFFWAYFQIALSPSIITGGVWPPQGICNFFFSNNINQFGFMGGDNKFFFSKEIFDVFAHPFSPYEYNLAVNASNTWLELLNSFSNKFKSDMILSVINEFKQFSFYSNEYLSAEMSYKDCWKIIYTVEPDFNIKYSTFNWWKSINWKQGVTYLLTDESFYRELVTNKSFAKTCIKNIFNMTSINFPLIPVVDVNTGNLIIISGDIISNIPDFYLLIKDNLYTAWDSILAENFIKKMNYTLSYKYLFSSTDGMGFTHEIFRNLDALIRKDFESGNFLYLSKKFIPSLIFTIFNEGVLINPFKKPLLNTFILLTSGATITISHKLLKLRFYSFSMVFLQVTIILSYLFLVLQFMEYCTAGFSLNDGVYGSIFFVLTGFHGLHVIIGSIFLSVSFYRFSQQHFTPAVHLGFEFAIWYWHFVDVVWLFLYFTLYLWPNSYFFTFAHISVFPHSLSFAAQVSLNYVLLDLNEVFKYHVYKFDWDITKTIISELLDNGYIFKRFIRDIVWVHHIFPDTLPEKILESGGDLSSYSSFYKEPTEYDDVFNAPLRPQNSYRWLTFPYVPPLLP